MRFLLLGAQERKEPQGGVARLVFAAKQACEKLGALGSLRELELIPSREGCARTMRTEERSLPIEKRERGGGSLLKYFFKNFKTATELRSIRDTSKMSLPTRSLSG